MTQRKTLNKISQKSTTAKITITVTQIVKDKVKKF